MKTFLKALVILGSAPALATTGALLAENTGPLAPTVAATEPATQPATQPAPPVRPQLPESYITNGQRG